MSELLKPGVYRGKIVDYGLKKTKGGGSMAVIAIEIDEANTVYWQGAFSGGASEFTIKTLIDLGFNPNGSLLNIAKGPESNTLDINQNVKCEVIHEANAEGKMYAKAKWINGGQGIRDRVSYADAVKTFPGIDGLLAEFKSKNPGAVPKATPSPAVAAVDDIPF